MQPDSAAAYDHAAPALADRYESVGFEAVHADALAWLPARPGLVLDIGAGSGRDAAWFAAGGWEVVAAEPAAALRADAQRRHPSPRIRWLDDRLPGLARVRRLGLAFDLLWLSAIWQHLPPEARPAALRGLALLLRPGGRAVITLRHGPAPADRPMWPVDAAGLARLALDHGLALRAVTPPRPSALGAAGVTWQTALLELPDDGGAALPLLRGVILRQEKSATYKLALLRCVLRIADGAPNLAEETADGVLLPLGLVALTWLRLFKPLLAARLPQRPGEGMGFVGDAFAALAPVPAPSLRPGAEFTGDVALALHRAIADAARLIEAMPARHLTDAADRPLFGADCRRPPRPGALLRLDRTTLRGFGTLHVPLPLWQALRRMAAWVEPMLVAEWVRLTQGYAARAGRPVTAEAVQAALHWQEPGRDAALVRSLAAARLRAGDAVPCVWTGAPLGPRGLDIDHCLPWAAWPCGDLWNLLPAAPAVNRAGKRGRIVSAGALAAARPRILAWWDMAYAAPSLRARFAEEARAALPLPWDGALSAEEVFDALDFRRLRLRQDTQLPEWDGGTPP
ncbi:methyltransferase domain-containing protein [Paracraurococcus ruber]|nr:methyltransferase domain-containing protein [Paracraurococcus ruber]